jgi:hypothetical protein
MLRDLADAEFWGLYSVSLAGFYLEEEGQAAAITRMQGSSAGLSGRAEEGRKDASRDVHVLELFHTTFLLEAATGVDR